jgi:hypothetical protein
MGEKIRKNEFEDISELKIFSGCGKNKNKMGKECWDENVIINGIYVCICTNTSF